jgi:hypothetical protein
MASDLHFSLGSHAQLWLEDVNLTKGILAQVRGGIEQGL